MFLYFFFIFLRIYVLCEALTRQNKIACVLPFDVEETSTVRLTWGLRRSRVRLHMLASRQRRKFYLMSHYCSTWKKVILDESLSSDSRWANWSGLHFSMMISGTCRINFGAKNYERLLWGGRSHRRDFLCVYAIKAICRFRTERNRGMKLDNDKVNFWLRTKKLPVLTRPALWWRILSIAAAHSDII